MTCVCLLCVSSFVYVFLYFLIHVKLKTPACWSICKFVSLSFSHQQMALQDICSHLAQHMRALPMWARQEKTFHRRLPFKQRAPHTHQLLRWKQMWRVCSHKCRCSWWLELLHSNSFTVAVAGSSCSQCQCSHQPRPETEESQEGTQWHPIWVHARQRWERPLSFFFFNMCCCTPVSCVSVFLSESPQTLLMEFLRSWFQPDWWMGGT